MIDWFLRFIKGIFVGSGFILPGISGGALAAVFGIYERIIAFLANMKHEFKKNVIYLIPVALGVAVGIVIFSFAASFLLERYEEPILWLFIGCIVGTLPTLWRHAGEQGRENGNIIIMGIVFIISLAFLVYGQKIFTTMTSPNFLTWLFSGILIGLGLVIPGLSPSNFLLYMGVYGHMLNGIKEMNIMIIIPILLGAISAVLLLSKLINYALEKIYSKIFHAMIGIVLASTIVIIPQDFDYISLDGVVCFLLFIIGIGIGYSMCLIEKKYK